MQNPGDSRRGNAVTRHCEERKRRSNPASFAQKKKAGLLRFARNDGIGYLKIKSNSVVPALSRDP
jgi:hypothetical protein